MRRPTGRFPIRCFVASLPLVALSLAGLACATGAGAPPELTATITPTVTATATAIPTATPRPDPLTLRDVSPALQELQGRIEQEISAFSQRVGGDFAVVVTDLQTGETVHVNGDDLERIPGCTINFFVLLLVAQDLQAGRYPESDVGGFIARTVWASDPGTAHYLLRLSGGGSTIAGLWKVNDLLRNKLQLASAVYDHPPANDAYALVPGEWQPNRITPLDFNRALTMLYRGELLDPEWTAYLIEKMSHVKPGLNHLIPAGVGDPAAVVAHKNGYIDYVPYYVDNDVGIVTFRREEKRYAYALTFWSQDNPWVLSDVTLGQAVSRLVWDYFNATYQ